MKTCVLQLCNGSGLLSRKDGSFVPCGCRRYKRAEEIFRQSGAPTRYKSYIEDLPFDPPVQNMRKKAILEAKQAKGDITPQEYQNLRQNEFSPLKSMLSQFDDGKNGKPIKRFIQHNFKLYFYGDTGTAKTGSAIALAMEAGKRNCQFYYISLHEIAKLFRYNFSDPNEAHDVSLAKRRIEEADILIVDDLGKEIDALNLHNESDIKLLKQILTFLDGAIRKKERLVIFTSNMKVEEARNVYQKLDPRLASIMFDGNFLAYQFREKIRQQDRDAILDDLI